MTKPRAWNRRLLLALPLLIPLAPTAAPGSATGAVPGTRSEIEILGEAPGTGEQCLVCRQPVHGAVVLRVRYKGRVFHVNAAMMDELEADPEPYFRALQSRSALFDEDALEQSIGTAARGRGWLYLGFFVLAGLAVGALCGALAVVRGHPPLPWFGAGLVLNVLAFALLVFLPRGERYGPEGVPAGLGKVPLTRAPRRCPCCGAPHHPAARACAACRERLTPEVEAETACLEGDGG